MSAKKPRVVVTRRLTESVEARLCALFDVTLNLDDRPMTSAQLLEAMAKADILVPTVTDSLPKTLIEDAGPQLKLIANFGAGVDHIDVDAARKKGIIVSNTPGVLTEDSADIAMALILATPRRLSEGAQMVREGKWEGWAPTQLLGRRVSGKHLGILGMGRIGRAVAKRAKGFGLVLHYHKRERLHASVEQELGLTYWEDFGSMLEVIDILTLHCPHTERTHHMVSSPQFLKMKRGAYLINTARGPVVDESAMIEALKNGQLAGAGLDVYENEPHINPQLRALSNVVLLPHISSATVEAREGMGEKVLINIQSFVHGHPLPDRVLG